MRALSLTQDIEFVTTASHGGYWLGPARWEELKETFPTFEPYAGVPWLEEDCDGTLAILLWPDLHRDVQVWGAVRLCQKCAEGDHALEVGHRWLAAGGKRALALRMRADAWEAANHDTWLQGGGSTTPDHRWTSEWRRVGSDERRLLVTRDIPTERAMTTAELDAAMVASRTGRGAR